MNKVTTNLKYNNLAELIEASMQQYADTIAYQCLGQSYSFAEVDRQSAILAAYFLNVAKLQAGDRVVIQLPNLIQYPIFAYAALRAGLVLVNTNPLYTEREMKHQFTDSGAKAVIILAELLPKLDGFISETNVELVISTQATDLLMPAANEAAHDKSYNLVSFHQALAQAAEFKCINRAAIKPDDIAAIQYTGGTTGLSKGAVLTHKNLLSNINQTAGRLEVATTVGEESFITPLPLYHIYAFLLNLWVFSSGNRNVLIPNPRDLDGFVDTLISTPPTGFSGINTLFLGLCYHPKINEVDFSGLKLTVSGGSALTSAAADNWQKITGCTISEGYGLSETSPVVSLNPPGQEQIGTIGYPVNDTEVQIWDDEANEVAQGEAGELVVRGPQVMQGYWQQEAETNAVLTADGWFKTGDIAVALPDGFLKIVDRKKDMIIVSGFNVYPNEVENILMLHPDILESAVVGEVSDKCGELVSAFVVKKPQAELSEQAIVDYCRTQLTGYKVPKKITFLAELPKSNVGKVLRKDLRK